VDGPMGARPEAEGPEAEAEEERSEAGGEWELLPTGERPNSGGCEGGSRGWVGGSWVGWSEWVSNASPPALPGLPPRCWLPVVATQPDGHARLMDADAFVTRLCQLLPRSNSTTVELGCLGTHCCCFTAAAGLMYAHASAARLCLHASHRLARPAAVPPRSPSRPPPPTALAGSDSGCATPSAHRGAPGAAQASDVDPHPVATLYGTPSRSAEGTVQGAADSLLAGALCMCMSGG
jgi:hypothetical protein